MALAIDSSAGADLGTVSSGSYNFTMGSVTDGLLVVGITIESSSDLITGVTFNSVSMTCPTGGNQVASNDVERSYLFLLANPASGTHSITISASSSIRIISRAVSYSGANQSTTPDNINFKKNSTTSPISNSLTTVADNCWVVSYFNNTGESDATADTGTTLRGASTVGRAIGDSNSAVTPAGSYTMGWAWTAPQHGNMFMMSIAPAATTTTSTSSSSSSTSSTSSSTSSTSSSTSSSSTSSTSSSTSSTSSSTSSTSSSSSSSSSTSHSTSSTSSSSSSSTSHSTSSSSSSTSHSTSSTSSSSSSSSTSSTSSSSSTSTSTLPYRRLPQINVVIDEMQGFFG